jgi:adenosine deaminase CECR1
MRVFVFTAVLLAVALAQGNCATLECYEQERAALVALDEASFIGGDETLSANEKVVEAMLQQLRSDMTATYIDPPLPQRNWRNIADWARTTKLYQLLQAMPKGANLHAHGFVDMRVAVAVGTYLPSCYVNLRADSLTLGTFVYASAPPQGWTNTVAARANAGDVAAFDTMLWNLTQFWTPPLTVNETSVWYTFDHTIMRAFSLLADLDVAGQVFLKAFETFASDGMQHIELRVSLDFGRLWFGVFSSTLAQFNARNNQTITVRFIVQQLRRRNDTTVLDTMKATLALMQANQFVVGFDLVDEEDAGFTLHHYASDFIAIRNYALQAGLAPLPFYFHCAETDNVTHAASNAFDAILLNSKRLGHALGLRDHPWLMKIVNTSRIGLELCPVSNQILRFFEDIRTHPGATYVAEGLPVTLSSDDPEIYGYTSAANTPEFFMAYLSWDLSLASVKQIAVNSLLYSALGDTQKQQKLAQFESMYQTWIAQVASGSFIFS